MIDMATSDDSLLEREAARTIGRGQALLGRDQLDPSALLAMADDLTSLIDRLAAEKQRVEDALRSHDKRIRAVTAYGRH